MGIEEVEPISSQEKLGDCFGRPQGGENRGGPTKRKRGGNQLS